MTDRELELQLRTWYRTEVPPSQVAPATLLARVGAIPRTVARPKLVISRRRTVLLAVAAAIAATLGTLLLAGSAIVDQLNPSPRPTASALTTETIAPRGAAWGAGPQMLQARSGDIIGITTWAALLSDGRVLAAGGLRDTNMPTTQALASAEIYDPASRTWTATGPMTQERTGHTMTVLRDGRVLVTGGSANFHSPTLDSAELYDPLTGTWSPTASMHEARAYHTATRLPDGRVLVAGGSRSSQCGSQGCSRTNDVVEPAEIYDPTTGQWTEVGGMPAPRQNQAATLLDDGTVLIEGGGRLIGLSSAQLFDPATSAWRETGSMRAFRNEPSATLLADGRVFVVGGQIRVHQTDEAIPAEIFDPATSSWTATSASPIPIGYATATLLRDGKVLVVGPTGIELYDPSANAWSSILNGKGRVYHMAIGLPDGTVLVAGGIYDSVLNSTAIYNPGGLP